MSFASTYSALSVRGWSNPDVATNVIYYNNLLQPTQTDIQTGTTDPRAKEFGRSADISTNGNYIVVGESYSYYSTLTGAYDGAVYVYENTISGQALDTILTSNANSTIGFGGATCAINNYGNIIAVGAPYANVGNYTNAGSVYIFAKSGGNWSLATTINSGFGSSNVYFGTQCKLSDDGTVLLVTHPGGTGFTNLGASIYYNNGNANAWALYTQTIKPANTNPEFGCSIALAKSATSANLANIYYAVGDRVAGPNNEGLTYVFQSTTQLANLVGNTALSAFGQSIAMNNAGNVLVVGAPGLGAANIVGSAKVFANVSGSYAFQANIAQPNATSKTAFGVQVAVTNDANIILIGETESNVTLNGNTGPITYSNIGRGYAYSGSGFSYSQSNTYISSQIQYPLNPVYFQTNYFSTYGVVVDGSGNNRLFGSTNDTYTGNVAWRVGSEYIFNS